VNLRRASRALRCLCGERVCDAAGDENEGFSAAFSLGGKRVLT
jgi:hypothetical protein